MLPEGPLSVAVHPSGLMLAVGCADKLRLMNVLMDDISEGYLHVGEQAVGRCSCFAGDVKEFPIKGCSEVRFSKGGHMIAAVNGSVVQIYK